MDQLILFDIDGTLLKTGAGRASLEAVFEGTGADLGFSFAGLTDCDIISRALESIDETPTIERVSSWLHRYIPILERTLSSMTVSPIPGTVDLLDALPSTTHISVGTGNCRAGAHAKLSAANLAFDLTHGVFGDTHRSRTSMFRELVPSHFDRVVVVGDTPADIAAGHAVGGFAG